MTGNIFLAGGIYKQDHGIQIVRDFQFDGGFSAALQIQLESPVSRHGDLSQLKFFGQDFPGSGICCIHDRTISGTANGYGK